MKPVKRAVTFPVPNINPTINDLLNEFLRGKSERTIEAYRQDLESFTHFLGENNINEAARKLLQLQHGQANHIALQYRNWLVEQGLAPATMNRRLAALRSMVALGRQIGLVEWTLNVRNVKSRSFRDTRGCGIDGVRDLLSVAANQRNKMKSARDIAIIRLLFDLALRRSEVCNLDIKHVDLPEHRIWVQGKGYNDRIAMTLPEETAKVIKEWIQERGFEEGALFLNCDRAEKGHRLTTNGLYKLIRSLGRKANMKTHPHALRHASITTALDLLNGNLRLVSKHARHANPQVTILYDDKRRDDGGEVAKKLASAV